MRLCHGGINAMTASRGQPQTSQKTPNLGFFCRWKHHSIHNLFISATKVRVKQHRSWCNLIWFEQTVSKSTGSWAHPILIRCFVIATVTLEDIPGIQTIKRSKLSFSRERLKNLFCDIAIFINLLILIKMEYKMDVLLHLQRVSMVTQCLVMNTRPSKSTKIYVCMYVDVISFSNHQFLFLSEKHLLHLCRFHTHSQSAPSLFLPLSLSPSACLPPLGKVSNWAGRKSH